MTFPPQARLSQPRAVCLSASTVQLFACKASSVPLWPPPMPVYADQTSSNSIPMLGPRDSDLPFLLLGLGQTCQCLHISSPYPSGYQQLKAYLGQWWDAQMNRLGRLPASESSPRSCRLLEGQICRSDRRRGSRGRPGHATQCLSRGRQGSMEKRAS